MGAGRGEGREGVRVGERKGRGGGRGEGVVEGSGVGDGTGTVSPLLAEDEGRAMRHARPVAPPRSRRARPARLTCRSNRQLGRGGGLGQRTF